MSDKTPEQVAYEAYAARITDLRAQYAGIDFPSAAPQSWDRLSDDYRSGWKAAVQTARADLEQQLAAATDFARRLERITTAWTRGMYAAQIDCIRGDAASAARILSEGLDGFDGEPWNGTETGTGWWERTKAEEGL